MGVVECTNVVQAGGRHIWRKLDDFDLFIASLNTIRCARLCGEDCVQRSEIWQKMLVFKYMPNPAFACVSKWPKGATVGQVLELPVCKSLIASYLPNPVLLWIAKCTRKKPSNAEQVLASPLCNSLIASYLTLEPLSPEIMNDERCARLVQLATSAEVQGEHRERNKGVDFDMLRTICLDEEISALHGRFVPNYCGIIKTNFVHSLGVLLELSECEVGQRKTILGMFVVR